MEAETNNGLYGPVTFAGGIVLFILFSMLMGCSGPRIYISEKHEHDNGQVGRYDVMLDCGGNTGSMESPKYVCDLKPVMSSEVEYWRTGH